MRTHADKIKKNRLTAAAETVSGDSPAFQLQDNRPQSAVQRKQVEAMSKRSVSAVVPVQRNTTGLPDQLKTGVEHLSGHSMDDVKVHYNSSEPAQLNAHAYTQGNAIHIAPGQEKQLPHEAWHVAQQKQGRVQATTQLKDKIAINDDDRLEKEADVMGAKASQLKSIDPGEKKTTTPTNSPAQRSAWSTGKLDGKNTDVNWSVGTLGGDTVGMEMIANPLGPEHLQGSPPKSGAQKTLMNQLPTDPGLSNENKYIRGHLLNDNLGGPGVAENLYPITANANKEHERVIESKVKHWVNDEKQWVYYHVKVNQGKVDLSQGYVASQFLCTASILDPSTGHKINTVSANITSQPAVSHKTNESAAVDNGNRGAVGPQAKVHTALLSTSKKRGVSFDQETLEHLQYLFTLPEAAKALKKLVMEYEGIGKGTAEALSQYSPTTETDKKVMAALKKVYSVIGNDDLLSIIGDAYDEIF